MALIRAGDGLELNCEIDDFTYPWESRTPALLQHGLARNASFWRKWVPGLAASRRAVYRPDMRGCGQSAMPPLDFTFTPRQIVDDVLTIMDRLKLERVHWVGEASGGIVGQLLALEHPDRVASFVLCDTPSRIPDRMRSALSLGASSSAAAKRREGMANWTAKTIGNRIDTAVAPYALVQWMIEQMGSVPDHVGAGISECMGQVDITEAQRTLDIPTLVIFGEHHADVRSQEAIVDRLPNAQAFRVPGVGAGVQHVLPDACVQRTVRFWERLDRIPKESHR